MKRRVTSVIIATSLLAGQMSGFAAEQPSNSSLPGKTRESSFEACKEKGVRLVSAEDYAKNKAVWDKTIASCGGEGGSVQVIRANSIFGQYQQHDQDVQFLSSVGNKIVNNLDKNMAFMKSLKECFSADKSLDASCAGKKEIVFRKLDEAAKKARIELMLSQTQHDTKRDYGMRTNVDAALNRDMRKFSAGMVSNLGFPVADAAATPQEIEAAKKIAAQELNEAVAKAKAAEASAAESKADTESLGLASGGSSESARMFAFSQTSSEQMAKHQTAYRSIVEDEMPILGHLPKGNFDRAKQKWSWSDSQISAAIDGAIGNAQKLKESTANTLKEGKIEHFTGQAAYKNIISGHGDLMSLLAQTPAVEDVLKEHPEYCGAVTALTDQKWYSDMRYGVGSMAGFMVTGGIAGVAAKAAGAGAVAAVGTSMFVAGAGMGVYDMGSTWADKSAAERNGFVSTGLAANGEEKSVQEKGAIAEKESAFTSSVGLNTLFSGIGGPAVMGSIRGAQALIKAGRAAGGEGIRLVFASAAADAKAALLGKMGKFGIVSEETAQRAIASKKELDAVKAEMYGTSLALPGGKASREQISAIDTAANALSNKGTGKAADENRQIILSAMANPVLSPADEETAQLLSKAVLERINPEVLTYDKAGEEGVAYLLKNQLREEIKDLKLKNPGNYAKLATDEEVLNEVVENSLRKTKLVDEKDIKGMRQCLVKGS